MNYNPGWFSTFIFKKKTKKKKKNAKYAILLKKYCRFAFIHFDQSSIKAGNNTLETGKKIKKLELFEPAHDKTYNKTCATSKAQISLRIRTVWSETLLIAAFCSLQAIHRGINGKSCHMYGLICLCWSHRSYCRFCRALAHVIWRYNPVNVLLVFC